MRKNISLLGCIVLFTSNIYAFNVDYLADKIANKACDIALQKLETSVNEETKTTHHYVREPKHRHYVKKHHKKYHCTSHKKVKRMRKITDEMKIQNALSKLGFYRAPIDGEINSFETRSAIKKMNKEFGISETASLKSETKDTLIFLSNLFEFDRTLIAKGKDSITKGKQIQTALKIHGFYFGEIDGKIGSITKSKIAEYKNANNLSDGEELDFEEEYRLLSSAKKLNDENLEETIASLKVKQNSEKK